MLLEAFRDGAAGEQHVKSEHFQQAMQVMPRYLAATPRILNSEMPGEDWSLRMSSRSGEGKPSRSTSSSTTRYPIQATRTS